MTAAPVRNAYDGLASLYDQRRPSYPAEAVRAVAALATRTAPSGSVFDVGCGTGIFTRLLAAELPETFPVTGVEPGADMRATAASRAGDSARLRFIAGKAESLPIDANSAVLLTAATAAHWFDRPLFYAEAARALAPGGALAIVQNERRWWDSAGLADYESLLESLVSNYRRGMHANAHDGYGFADYAAELSSNTMFATPEVRTWNWEMDFGRDAFIEFSQTSSIVQRAIARAGRGAYCRALEKLVDRHGQNGAFTVQYRTMVVVATPREKGRDR